jgi:2-oxoisovalerate dehydrogenase E1 component
LPTTALLAHAEGFERVVVADETRRSGSVAEAIVAALVDASWQGRVTRVTSRDSYVPLGPAAAHVLMSEDDIVRALRDR